MSETLQKIAFELIGLISHFHKGGQEKNLINKERQIYDFRAKKLAYEESQIHSLITKFVEQWEHAIPRMEKEKVFTGELSPQVIKEKIKESWREKEYGSIKNLLERILPSLSKIPEEEKQTFTMVLSSHNLPEGIRAEMEADFREMQKCFQNDCLRSTIILCGRLLETALHRKYFEATKNDLLEKSPGIGLGNIIARLMEHKVSIPPGLMNQIHLINQVRIFSVHKKQEPFYPSRAQAEAIVLFTLDAVEKLFP
ncbi:DUF4145 domain-containing protein [Candidatus Woesearchaeota archaeon]|nr:DUF4145 domain-containing protein [Candidatus Woesearchaeota archaeon]